MMVHVLRDRLARHLLLPAHGVYRSMRRDYRPAQRAARDALRFRREASGWPDHRKRDWILERLRGLLRRAQAESPYYRDLFRQAGFDPDGDFGFRDFARIPTLGKDHLLEHAERLRSATLPERLVRSDSTGGSTGQPVRVWKGPGERGWAEGGWQFFTEQLGCREAARTAFLWGHHLDARPRKRSWPTLSDLLSNAYWFDCFHLDDAKLLQYHRELTDLDPECLVAYGGALAALANVLERRGLGATYPRRAIITGAEKVWPHERTLIERVFGRPVHERYGSRDVGLMGIQLHPTESTDFTVDWCNVLVEPETEGESPTGILVTKLNGDGMFLIRYRVGDLAVFPPGARSGGPAFSLVEVAGRELEGIVNPSGGWIHGAVFPHMMKDYPVRDFQVHQHADSSLTVRLVTRGDWTADDEAALRKQLAGIVPEVAINLSFVDEIPRTPANKRRPVISDLAPDRSTASEGR